MKTFLISTLLGILAINLSAQDETIPTSNFNNNAVRVSLVDFFMNTFYLEYEHMFKNRTSLVANGEIILGEENSNEYMGYGTGAQFRIYSSELITYDFYKAEGMYLGPYIHYRNVELANWETNDELLFTTLKAGVLAGLQITFLDKISVDLNIGGGIQIANGSDDEQEYYYIFDLFEPDFTGIKPMGNITVGLKF